MLKAAIDTNAKVSIFLSTNPMSASSLLFRAFRDREFLLVESLETIAELRLVLSLHKDRVLRSIDDSDIENFARDFEDACQFFAASNIVPHSFTRDITDTKFLNLALAADADYLVTNDRRHLLRLKRFGRTKIITPHKFILALKKQRSNK